MVVYETSPVKVRPKVEPQPRPRVRPEVNQRLVKTNNIKKKNTKVIERKKNAKVILGIVFVFGVLLLICYRYALINTNFTEKEKLKNQLSELQKVNAQLKVNIEQQMNINNIKQEAKERLGMQKLSNDQKVYVSLDKKDYIESSSNIVVKDETETWWDKFLKLLKIKQ